MIDDPKTQPAFGPSPGVWALALVNPDAVTEYRAKFEDLCAENRVILRASTW
jgi:hypothetical protein